MVLADKKRRERLYLICQLACSALNPSTVAYRGGTSQSAEARRRMHRGRGFVESKRSHERCLGRREEASDRGTWPSLSTTQSRVGTNVGWMGPVGRKKKKEELRPAEPMEERTL